MLPRPLDWSLEVPARPPTPCKPTKSRLRLQRVAAPFTSPFSVHGSWAGWEEWGTCSVTCGNGVSFRIRACADPSPVFGGEACEGPSQEEMNCTGDNCPGDNNNLSIFNFAVKCFSLLLVLYKGNLF